MSVSDNSIQQSTALTSKVLRDRFYRDKYQWPQLRNLVLGSLTYHVSRFKQFPEVILATLPRNHLWHTLVETSSRWTIGKWGNVCLSLVFQLEFLLLWQSTMTKEQVGEERIALLYTSILVHHRRKSGQELKQYWNPAATTDAETTEGWYLLTCFPCFALLTSYRVQEQQPKVGATHHGLGPLTSITY